MPRLENRFVNLTAADLAEAAAALGSQEISGSAPPVAQFEADLAAFFGRKHAVCVNSGTVSIFCAMQSAGIKPGDEIILPATSVTMSAMPSLMIGAKVVIADTEPDGFGFDVADLQKVLTPKTKMVISVPLWGYPAGMDSLVNFCRANNLLLLEDVSQSHGAMASGRYLGTFGQIGCFSTHERKLITTGEGGFVLTDDTTIADGVNVWRRYGADNKLGCNFKLGAINAAVGRTQIRKLTAKIAVRRLVANKLRARLSAFTWMKELPIDPANAQNYYALVYTITDPTIQVKLFEKHLASKDVISDTYRYNYRPLYKYPLFSASARPCPNAESLISRVFTLPCHEGMTDADVDQVIAAVTSFTPGP